MQAWIITAAGVEPQGRVGFSLTPSHPPTHSRVAFLGSCPVRTSDSTSPCADRWRVAWATVALMSATWSTCMGRGRGRRWEEGGLGCVAEAQVNENKSRWR